MEELEISGKTVEESIQRALRQLGVTREQVEVTVLNEGRSGILGIGAEEARIRVKLLVPTHTEGEDIVGIARNVLEKLLEEMEITATVVTTGGSFVEGSEEGMPVTFDIRGDDLGILIGRRGQSLAALQYIVRLVVAQQTKSMAPIIIDVEGYKQRHYESLRALAKRMAEQVTTKKSPMALRPMPAYERRIIHLALADHPSVITQSTGMGIARKVVIIPKR